LLDYDFERQASEAFILAILQLGSRHVDRSLVVRDHHGCKVAIGISGRLDNHCIVHPLHGLCHQG